MYKEDLALNNLQRLICHKTQPTITNQSTTRFSLEFLINSFVFSGRFYGELPECTLEMMFDVTKSFYQNFIPLGKGKN